jgi:hypothetical protein
MDVLPAANGWQELSAEALRAAAREHYEGALQLVRDAFTKLGRPPPSGSFCGDWWGMFKVSSAMFPGQYLIVCPFEPRKRPVQGPDAF